MYKLYTKALCIFVIPVLAVVVYGFLAENIATRLNHFQAPKSAFGVVPVGTDDFPIRPDGIDIIFIHGLGSNPDTTWRAKFHPAEEALPGEDRFVNWISDFLPDDLRTSQHNIRLFFYNYDTYWKRDALKSRLENLGNEFLEDLHSTIRKSEAEQSRHLILMAHSHGGLVVKQAFVQAQLDAKFHYVVKFTKAILFLGSPHRGTSFGKWGWVFAQALRPLGSNPSILADLGYDAAPLHELHKNFIKSTRDNCHVFNFFEKRPTEMFRIWSIGWQEFRVLEQSATYAGREVRNIGLPVDHYGLNKFGSRSATYGTIKSKLVEVIKELIKPAKRHYCVPLERVATYVERTEMSRMLEEGLRIQHKEANVPHAVVLHGLSGTGKSQLALEYAARQRAQYNPILWLDATNEETMHSSFRRCAAELELQEDSNGNQGSIFEDPAVLAVNRWLLDRTEVDDKWLVVIDNADDVTWNVRKIMPEGIRGNIIITSQDSWSVDLVKGGCEQVHVEVMAPMEGAALLLKHLHLDADSASEETQYYCNKVAQKLGYLPLAIDLAGAFISNNPTPQHALLQYLDDYDRHHDYLLRKDDFAGLRPTEKTVWTVWDTTLKGITRKYEHIRPDLLLTFLAQFGGSNVQEELFRLASLGMATIDAHLDKKSQGMPSEVQQFFTTDNNYWDSFRYRQARDVLLRYSLVQRVEGDGIVEWDGVRMHNLVRWRAKQGDQVRPWQWWHKVVVLAACCQLLDEERPNFRRHLIKHLQDINWVSLAESKDLDGFDGFANLVGENLGKVYLDEGRTNEAEELLLTAQARKSRLLGDEHPDTLRSKTNLALVYKAQGRFKKAEELLARVLESKERVLGEGHPDTLMHMANLASIYGVQSRWIEAEDLLVRVLDMNSRQCWKKLIWKKMLHASLARICIVSEHSAGYFSTISQNLDLWVFVIAQRHSHNAG